MDDVLTVKDAAKALKLSVRSVRLEIKAKRLHAVKIGRAWRLRRSDVDALLEGGR